MNELMIADANVFHHAFTILANKMNEGVIMNNIKDIGLLMPVVVNGALGCELYIKSMLSSVPKTHKLNELFELLEQSIQSCVFSIMVDIGKMKDSQYDEDKFREQLGEYGDSFVEWRYFYEYEPKIDINFIKNLLAVLEGIVDAKRKGIDLSKVEIHR